MECAIRRQLPFRYRFYTVFSEISFLTFALHSQKSGGCAPPVQRTLQQKDADSPRRMHSPLLVKSMTCMWRSTSVSVRASLSAGKCANNHLVHPTFCCPITREFYQFRILFRSRRLVGMPIQIGGLMSFGTRVSYLFGHHAAWPRGGNVICTILFHTVYAIYTGGVCKHHRAFFNCSAMVARKILTALF